MDSGTVEVVEALRNNVRVNNSNNTVEIYDDYGVKMVLRDLTPEQLDAFRKNFRSF